MILLAGGTLVDYKGLIKFMLTAAAKISGMLFKDAKSDVINGKNNTDAKYRFAKYDEQHQSGIPFAGF